MKKKSVLFHAAVLLLLASCLAGQARADTSQIGMAIRSAREIAEINRANQRDFNDFMEGQLTQMAIANANSSQVVPTARLAQWLTDLLVSDMSPSNRQAFANHRGALVGMARQVSDFVVLFRTEGLRLLGSSDADDQRAGLAFLMLAEIPAGGSPADIVNILNTCLRFSDSGMGLTWFRKGNFGKLINQLSSP